MDAAEDEAKVLEVVEEEDRKAKVEVEVCDGMVDEMMSSKTSAGTRRLKEKLKEQLR